VRPPPKRKLPTDAATLPATPADGSSDSASDDASGNSLGNSLGSSSGSSSANSSGTPCYPPFLGEALYLSADQLTQSLDHTLSQWRDPDEFWIFGYGSLIWRPELPALETIKGRVPGYHRGLYLWSRINRGTPLQPGLVLALDRGGCCTGVAYRVDQTDLRSKLEALWLREMAMGSYRPAWLRCVLADGRQVSALTFVMRRGIPTYAGRLPDEVVRTVFQLACGRYGTTLDYVTRTVEALRESGICDATLEALLERCGQTPGQLKP
jgi:cation transport protein ChaC